MSEKKSKDGISLFTIIGVLLAAICSLSNSNGLFWVALHAFCGWFYIAYLFFGFGGGLPSNFW